MNKILSPQPKYNNPQLAHWLSHPKILLSQRYDDGVEWHTICPNNPEFKSFTQTTPPQIELNGAEAIPLQLSRYSIQERYQIKQHTISLNYHFLRDGYYIKMYRAEKSCSATYDLLTCQTKMRLFLQEGSQIREQNQELQIPMDLFLETNSLTELFYMHAIL